MNSVRKPLFPVAARFAAMAGMLLASGAAVAQDGTFSWSAIGSGNQDANVGLSTSKTYLNAVDAGGWGGIVNGVTFARGNFDSNPSGSNYAVTGAGSTYYRDPINLGGELGKVVLDFVYGGTQTVTLSGLTAGELYTTTFYNFGWDPTTGSRWQTITTTGGATTTFDESFSGYNNASVLRYSFKATGASEAITFTPVTSGATFHNSAFTTEQAFNKSFVSGSNWTTSTWSTAGVPNAVGANADFTAQGSPKTLNLDAAQTAGNLRFSGSAPWTISGSNTLTVQADVGGRAILTAASGSHTIATPMAWNSDIWVTGTGSLVLSGQVGASASGITKTGAGTLVLSASNGFTGATDIQQGTVLIANSSALGAGGHDQATMTWIRDGATLALQGGISSGEHFHVWGSGVGGLGAIRSLSGNNALTNVDNSGGPGYALRSQTTVGVDAGSLSVTGFYESGGSYGLTKVGAGTLVLAGPSTYTGESFINAGTVVAANNNALGSGGFFSATKTSVADGATLALQGGISMGEHLHIWGNGVGGQGAIRNLSGDNALTSTGYALRSNATVGVDAGSLSVTQFYEEGGSFGLTKVGAGTLVLSASSGYTGNTRISGGTLATTAQNALPTATGLTVDNGSTLRLGANQQVASIAGSGAIDLGGSVLTAGGGNFTGTITGSGGLTKSGAGTWSLSGSSSYTGESFVNAGTLVVANNAALGAGGFSSTTKTTVADGATLALQGNLSLDEHLHISGTGVGGQGAVANLSGNNTLTNGVAMRNHATVGVAAGQLTMAGSVYQDGGVYGLTKVGAGTLVLTGSNNYGSETVISTGMLVAANSSALGTGGFSNTTKTTVYSGATLGLQGNISSGEHAHIYGDGVGGLGAIRNLSGNNALTSSGYALRSNATVGVDAGSLSVTQFYEEGGSFGLTKVGAGTLTLTASSNYTGATTVSAGKLVINGNQSAATGVVTVAAGAALGGSGTVGGATTIAGSHTPGNSPGVQTFASDLTYQGGSSVQWELAANSVSNSPVVFDQILVGGNLTFSGSTALSLAFNGPGSLVDWQNTAFWGTDHSWLIYDVAGTTTGFANLLLLTENWADASGDLFAQYLPNASFTLEQQGSDVYLTFHAVPEPSTVVLVGIGLVGLVLVRRRRQ